MEEKKEQAQPGLDERKKILELYVKQNPEKIKDPMLRDLCMDRKKHRDRIAGVNEELKSYLSKVQKMAAKAQAELSDANGAIKYVDSKIVQRHLELTELTDVGNNP
jgi:hypothetical protein